MNIYWVEQSRSDVPAGNGWLAESELRCLARLRIPKRHDDWRLGRWTAKSAVAKVLQVRRDDHVMKNIEVLTGWSGAPEVYVDRQPASISISLTHRDGVAACAVAQSATPLGCDLELIERRSDAFVGDYFTAQEQTFMAKQSKDERDRLVTTLWSAKESALKALRLGLTVDTRSVGVRLCSRSSEGDEQPPENGLQRSTRFCSSDEWHPFQASFENDQVLYGWWNASASLVRTLATFRCAAPPIVINSEQTSILSANSLRCH